MNKDKDSMFKIILLLMLTLNSWAANFVQGEGRFYSTSDDSLSFIKAQVTHNGFLDVISKEFTNMGLNKEVFWKKYNDKFKASFEPVEKALSEKYNIEQKPTPAQRQKYNEVLRIKKLKAKRKFGSLARIIQSFVVKRYTRSQQDPNARYMKLEATVNRNLLRTIYYDYIRGKRSSAYGSLFLGIKYNLKNTDYSDLGVAKVDDFTETVNNSWLAWFNKNKPDNIANIEILSEDKQNRLNDYFKLPYEKMISDIPDVFINSLYMKVEITIEKVVANQNLKEYKYNFSGGGYVLDLQANNILMSMNFNNEQKKYNKIKYEDLSTILANHVHRIPIVGFQKLKNKIKTIPPINSIQRVSLFDFSNMNDVDLFLQTIKGRGIKYSLDARLESIGTNRAELVVFMDGELSDLKTLLKGMQSAKNGPKFDFIDTDNILGVKFINSQSAEI